MAKYDGHGFIVELEPNEVFVFGSNGMGLHGGGAAATAFRRFGAIVGQSEGLMGQSYGINTMDGDDIMFEQIDRFKKFAASRPDLTFLLTEIGCGIAGYAPNEIAPYFKDCSDNVILPRSFKEALES